MGPKIKPKNDTTETIVNNYAETYLTMGAISQLVGAVVAGSITTPSFVITATSN